MDLILAANEERISNNRELPVISSIFFSINVLDSVNSKLEI